MLLVIVLLSLLLVEAVALSVLVGGMPGGADRESDGATGSISVLTLELAFVGVLLLYLAVLVVLATLLVELVMLGDRVVLTIE